MRIQILLFLFLLQSFTACNLSPEHELSLAGGIGFSSTDGAEKTQPTASNIVFKSADGGQTWHDVSAGLPTDLQVGRVFAGDNAVFLGAQTGLYRSTSPPVTQAWEKEFFPGDKITDIFPGRDGPYVCCYGSGFFQILPGAGIWKPMHEALKDKTIHAVLETPDGTLFVGCDSGVYKSADSGKTWKRVFADGMVASLAVSGNVLIGCGVQGLLRSTDDGEHWDWALTEDGTARKTGLLGSRFYAITSGNMQNRLRTSADGGKTWQRMDENLSPVRFFYNIEKADEYLSPVRFIYDIKQAGQNLFCSNEAGVFRSSDQGKTWELMLPSTRGQLFDLAVSGKVIYAVVIASGC